MPAAVALSAGREALPGTGRPRPLLLWVLRSVFWEGWGTGPGRLGPEVRLGVVSATRQHQGADEGKAHGTTRLEHGGRGRYGLIFASPGGQSVPPPPP